MHTEFIQFRSHIFQIFQFIQGIFIFMCYLVIKDAVIMVSGLYYGFGQVILGNRLFTVRNGIVNSDSPPADRIFVRLISQVGEGVYKSVQHFGIREFNPGIHGKRVRIGKFA